MDGSAPTSTPRHQFFEEARRRAHWSAEQLWIHYLALGGTVVVFDLEAYLAGLVPLPERQQDVLACALNERLADLYQEARVPYLHQAAAPGPARADALAVLDELLAAQPHHG